MDELMLKRTETSRSTPIYCYIYCIPLSDDVMKIGSCTGFLTSLLRRYTTYTLTKDLRLGLAYPISTEHQYAKEKQIRTAMIRSGFWLEHEKFMLTGFDTFKVLAGLILGDTFINLGDYIDGPNKDEVHYKEDYKNRKKDLNHQKKRVEQQSKEAKEDEVKRIRRIPLRENVEAFFQDDDWIVRHEDDPNHVIYVKDLMKAIDRRNRGKDIDSRTILKDGTVYETFLFSLFNLHLDTNRHMMLEKLGYKIVRNNLCVQCDVLSTQCKCKSNKRRCGPRYIRGYKLLK
jgi:hypothetical protein